MTRVFFSAAQRFGQPGSSRPLTHVRDALQRAFGSDFRAVSGDSFPEFADPRRLGDGLGPAFDERADHAWRTEDDKVPVGGDLFLGGGGASWHQLRTFLRTSVRCATGTLWFSSHFAYAQRVLAEEYRAFGINQVPIHPYLCWRAEREQLLSDFMIVPSEACKTTYPKELQDKIRVVEFGVDADRFKPTERIRDPSAPLRVLFPATNPARKGLRYVLQAWAHLPRDKFQLTITGAGLESANFGLGPNAPPVVTTGWVSEDDMLRLYQEHDALLLPSLEEGQALAALEAMACGLPIIVTPNVGVDHMGSGIGWKVPTRDGAAIRIALAEAEADREWLASKGRAARINAIHRPWSKFEDGIVRVVREEMA